jgi:predicted ATPase
VGYVAAVLKELRIENFKSFRRETIRFSPTGLTALVGGNGSGKTSVLEAAYYATFNHFPGTVGPIPGAALIRRGASHFLLRLEVDARGVAGAARVVDELTFEKQPSLTKWVEQPDGHRLYLWDDTKRNVLAVASAVTSVDLNAAANLVPFPRRFDVDLRKLRFAFRPVETNVADFDADQVVQTLFDLKMSNDVTAFNSLIAKVTRVVPALRGLRIRREVDGSVDKYALSFDMTSGGEIDAEQVSEGTLLAVALMAATAFSDRPTLLLIDDLDRALHPVAQRELVRLLRTAVQTSKLQIICTTHSPYILSEFSFDEVRVLKDIEGESRCMSLADGPDAARWMKELDAGEYWSFIEPKLFAKSA